MRERPMAESIHTYTRYSNENDDYNDFDDDDDELIPIKRDMFEMDPTPPLEQPITSVLRTVKNKVQPTKLIPTRMTNKYAIFTSDDDEVIIMKMMISLAEPEMSNEHQKQEPPS